MTLKDAIEAKMRAAFNPVHLEVLNESHMHSVPRGSETHFRVVAVSPQFEGLTLLKRHRLVNAAIAEEIANIRAMSLHTHTPAEWEKLSAEKADLSSPTCQGGSKSNL